MSYNIKDNSKPDGLRTIAGNQADDVYRYEDALSAEEIDACPSEQLGNKIATAGAYKALNNKLMWWIDNGYLPDPFAKPLVAIVPKMTSNTVPSGTAFASSEYGSGQMAWNAFSQVDNCRCGTRTKPTVGQYLGYTSTKQYVVRKVTYRNFTNSGSPYLYLTQFKVQGSNDGNTWTDITGVLNKTVNTTEQTFEFNNKVAYSSHRIIVVACNSTENVNFGALQFYGYEP